MKNVMGFQKSACLRAAIIILMLVGMYQSHDRIAKRTTDLSVPVPEKLWGNYLRAAALFSDDKNNYREKLGALNTPLLVISGDHDIVCPIENWYALTRKLPNMQIIMLPDSGHGPQHQHPQLSVNYINAFLESVN